MLAHWNLKMIMDTVHYIYNVLYLIWFSKISNTKASTWWFLKQYSYTILTIQNIPNLIDCLRTVGFLSLRGLVRKVVADVASLSPSVAGNARQGVNVLMFAPWMVIAWRGFMASWLLVMMGRERLLRVWATLFNWSASRHGLVETIRSLSTSCLDLLLFHCGLVHIEFSRHPLDRLGHWRGYYCLLWSLDFSQLQCATHSFESLS